MIIVEMEEFSGFAYLVAGTGGTLVEAGDVWQLKGPFLLEIQTPNGTHASDPVEFGDNYYAEAELLDQVYRLSWCESDFFNFTGSVIIRLPENGARFSIEQIDVRNDVDTEGKTILEPRGTWISLFPDDHETAANTFCFPTPTKLDIVELHALQIISAEGWYALSASLSDHIDVSIDENAEIHMPKATIILAPIMPVANAVRNMGRSLLIKKGNRKALSVRVTDKSMIRLKSSVFLKPKTFVSVERVVVAKKWLSVVEFTDDTVEVSELRPGDSSEGEPKQPRYELFARKANLAFHTPLPDSTDLETQPNVGSARTAFLDGLTPHFTYADPRVENFDPDHPYEHKDHFLGLKVHGIHSTRGEHLILDCNHLRMDLTNPRTGTGHFVVRGGSPLPKVGTSTPKQSFLVPKLRPVPGVPVEQWERLLEIPAGGVTTLVCSTKGSVSSGQYLVIDTNNSSGGQLKFVDVQLMGPPNGASGSAPEAATLSALNIDSAAERTFKPWRMRPAGGMNFKFDDEGIFPTAGDEWVEQFKPQPDEFDLLAHQGVTLFFDPITPIVSSSSIQVQNVEWTSVETHTVNSVTELLAYNVLHVALSYSVYRWVTTLSDDDVSFLKDERIIYHPRELKLKLPDEDRVVGDFLAVHTGDEIKTFVNDNLTRKPDDTAIYWPLFSSVSIALWRCTRDDDSGECLRNNSNSIIGRWCYEIARTDFGVFECYLGVDLSNKRSLDPVKLGYNNWDEAVQQAPEIWPNNADPGAVDTEKETLDPRDAGWIGFFWRNMPLAIPVDENILSGGGLGGDFPALVELYRQINTNLISDYGWKDEQGSTWLGHLQVPGDPGYYNLLPDFLDELLQFRLKRLSTKGSGGKMLGFDGWLDIWWGFISVDDGEGGEEPLRAGGRFALDFKKGEFTDFEIESPTTKRLRIVTTIPGFEKIWIKKIRTDLKTTTADFKLVPTEKLAAALPFFEGGRERDSDGNEKGFDLRLVIRHTNEDDPHYDETRIIQMKLILPKEQPTKLFGVWPFVFQGLSIDVGKVEGHWSVKMRATGRINLGMHPFESVGVTLSVGSDQEIAVSIDQIEGKLSFGNVEVQALLGLSRPETFNPSRALEPSSVSEFETFVSERKKNTDLYGWIKVKQKDGVLENAMPPDGVDENDEFAVRISNDGDNSFWCASFKTARDIPIGSSKFNKAMLLLSHKGDFNGNIKKLLTSTERGTLIEQRTLKLPDLLSSFQLSNDVGTVFAGSGFMQLHSTVLKSDETKKEHLTALMFSDGGLIRFDGSGSLFGLADVPFTIIINDLEGRLLAQIHLPETQFPPPPAEPTMKVWPGQLAIGIQYRVKRSEDYWFMFRLGWPPLRTGDDEFGRDWSKATKIWMDGFLPINTLKGGRLVELDNKLKTLRIGIAMGMGWEYHKKVGGGLASLTADAEISLAGVLDMHFSWGGAQFFDQNLFRQNQLITDKPAMTALCENAGLPHVALQSHLDLANRELIWSDLPGLSSIEGKLYAMRVNGIDFFVIAELHGRIYGSISGRVFGVEVVGVELDARALYVAKGPSNNDKPICHAYAKFRVTGKVKVGCYEKTFRGDAESTIVAEEDCRKIEQKRLVELNPVM